MNNEEKRNKKRYLISEICHKKYDCKFRELYRSYFLDYYPDRSERWEIKYKLKPFGKIERNNLSQALRTYSDYYKDVKYFKNLKKFIPKAEKCIGKDGIIKIEDLNIDRDAIFYYYLQHWSGLRHFVIYNYHQRFDDSIQKAMEGFGNILMERTIELNKREVMMLLFWDNIQKQTDKTMAQLLSKVEEYGWKTDEVKKKVKIYFLDVGDGKNYDDMQFLLRRLAMEIGDEKKKSGNIYYGSDFDQSISFAGMIMNPSNFKYFNEICLSRFLGFENLSGKLLFLGTRNYLVDRIEPLDLERFLYFSSIIFYFYGLRNPSDIDLTCYSEPKPRKNLDNFFMKYETGGEKMLGIGDLSIRGYGQWTKTGEKQHLENWFLKEWPALFGADGYDDMIFNPRFHINILGMKVITIEADLARRKERHRPASYADLIAYNFLMPIPIHIEEPPEKYMVSQKEESYNTPDKIRDLIRKIRNYLRSRYDINMDVMNIIEELNISPKRLEISEPVIRGVMREISLEKARRRIRAIEKIIRN